MWPHGPSLIIAYSHCIAHGINMTRGMVNQKIAVETGYWPLFRYNPTLAKEGKNPFKLDSKPPKLPLGEFTQSYRTQSFAEAPTYFPEVQQYNLGPDAYVELLCRAKRSLQIPVIGSLNKKVCYRCEHQVRTSARIGWWLVHNNEGRLSNFLENNI